MTQTSFGAVDDTSINNLFGIEKKSPTQLKAYDWVASSTRKYELAELPLSVIHVDKSYQRVVSIDYCRTLAKNWDMTLCGTILVAYRKNEKKCYVIDGQHRLTAAIMRGDILRIPCVITPTESVEDEAKLFYECNTHRRIISGRDKFKAKLIANDETALKIQECVSKHGFSLNHGGNRRSGLQCYSALIKSCSDDAVIFDKVVEILSNMTVEGVSCPGVMVQALHQLIKHGQIPDMERLKNVLQKEGMLKIIRIGKTNAINAGFSSNTYLPYIQAIILTYNKGLRNQSSKITYSEDVA